MPNRRHPIGNFIVQHNTQKGILYDKERSEYLQSVGYKVLRFWNNEMDDNIEEVYQNLNAIQEKRIFV